MKRIPTKPRKYYAAVSQVTGRINRLHDLRKDAEWQTTLLHGEDYHDRIRIEPVWVKPERRKGRKG